MSILAALVTLAASNNGAKFYTAKTIFEFMVALPTNNSDERLLSFYQTPDYYVGITAPQLPNAPLYATETILMEPGFSDIIASLHRRNQQGFVPYIMGYFVTRSTLNEPHILLWYHLSPKIQWDFVINDYSQGTLESNNVNERLLGAFNFDTHIFYIVLRFESGVYGQLLAQP